MLIRCLFLDSIDHEMTIPVTYREYRPSSDLADFVESFWLHENNHDQPETIIISPDSFFKIVIFFQESKIVKYFLTGLWTEPKEISIPPHCKSLGCRLKLLAPEYLLNRELADLRDQIEDLPLSFLNIGSFNFMNSDLLIKEWEEELRLCIVGKEIQSHKLRLSQMTYRASGTISATELARQVAITNRRINRYLKRYLGVSLKEYLNIQRVNKAYLNLRTGIFAPTDEYYDQSHFIREVKKYTGTTPRNVFQKINDRFIQLRNIGEK